MLDERQWGASSVPVEERINGRIHPDLQKPLRLLVRVYLGEAQFFSSLLFHPGTHCGLKIGEPDSPGSADPPASQGATPLVCCLQC